MKIQFHRHDHHGHHGKKEHHGKGKKEHKILKKMAKLERKLGKYNFDSSSENDSSSASDSPCNRSRSHSRSHGGRKGRRHHKQGKRFGSRGRSSSSSTSSGTSSDSSISSSASSDSSRSLSPSFGHHHHHHCHHHCNHHEPPRHLLRSRSFAGRSNRSPPPTGKGHHHHHPHPPHHRGRFWRHHQGRRHHDGIEGCLFRILAQSEPNLQEKPQNGEDRPDIVDLASPARSVSREVEEVASGVEEMNVDAQEVGEAAERLVESPQGPEINSILAENWAQILQNGLPADKKKALLEKYPVSKNCLFLRAPKLNKEILRVATEAAIKRDIIQMNQQNQIGTGLTALGQAISDLNDKSELKKDEKINDILESLNEAAVLLADVHHDITLTRQAFILPELKKGVRSVVENCKPDEFLYGKDFGEKVKNIKGFNKCKKDRCEKGEKRKHAGHDEKRKSKRLHTLGPFKKGFMDIHHGLMRH